MLNLGRAPHKLITVLELKDDLTFLNNQLPVDDKVKLGKYTKGNVDKPNLIRGVILARQKLIACDRLWVATRKSQLAPNIQEDEQETTRSLDERCASELDSIAFNFAGTASRQKYKTKEYKFQGTGTHAGSGDTEEGDTGDEDEFVRMLRESESSTMTGATDASSPSTGPHSSLGLRDWRAVYR
jgi:hypothetical protein